MMSRPLRTVATFVVGIAIYAGLPAIAWGAADTGGLMHDPARRAYVVTSLLLCAYAAIRVPEIGKPRQEAAARIERQRWAIPLLQALSIALMIVAPYGDRRGIATFADSPVLRDAGVVLFATGFLVMHWAELTLGRQFSLEVAIQPGHRLITSGVYHYVRHPRYLGIVVFMIGVALVFRSAAGVVLCAAAAAVLLWRIHDEEALMRREFGAEWDAYAAGTWRLVPGVF